MGLVANAVGTSGIGALLGYAHLLVVLLGAFFIVALVMNPLIVFLHIRRNPYPLVFATLREVVYMHSSLVVLLLIFQ